jgi:D-psicose/D-tagatose/L-ribulose 3-epimerase
MNADPLSPVRAEKFRYGAHQFLWTRCWTDDDLPILDRVRALGLTLFEVSLGDEVRFDARCLRRHADALGIELSIGPGNDWPMDCDISHDDPACRARGLAWHRNVLERAAECGAVAYCGALYSHPGRLCRRVPPVDELPRAADNLHRLAEAAALLGVRLVIEPMSRFRNHLVNTAEQAAHLADLAAHGNVSINLDTYHMITEERDYGAAIHRAAPRFWGLHACENDRGVPGGGLVPWPAVFTALRSVNGPVRLLLETYRTGASGFGFERGIFQDLCPDPEAFVAQGINFLKTHLGGIEEGE